MKRIEHLVNDLQDWKVESKKLPEDINAALSSLKGKVRILEKLDDEYFKNISAITKIDITIPHDFGEKVDKIYKFANILTKPITLVSAIIIFMGTTAGILFTIYKIVGLWNGTATP